MLAAVPPSIRPMVRLVPFGSNGEAGSAFAARSSASADRALISSTAAMFAETPRGVWLECASRPLTTTRKKAAPLWPPTAFISEGSPTMARAGRGRSRAMVAIISGAPKQPTSSS